MDSFREAALAQGRNSARDRRARSRANRARRRSRDAASAEELGGRARSASASQSRRDGSPRPRGSLTLVLDASVVVEACLLPAGLRRFRGEVLVAPPLLWPEVRASLH